MAAGVPFIKASTATAGEPRAAAMEDVMSDMLFDSGSSEASAPALSPQAVSQSSEGVGAALARSEPQGTPLAEALNAQMAAARGLCVSCVNDATCKLPRNASGPVFYCEEYQLPATPAAAATLPVAESTGRQPGGVPLMGLCVNCDAREECKFTKPEGGVWCCEEYR